MADITTTHMGSALRVTFELKDEDAVDRWDVSIRMHKDNAKKCEDVMKKFIIIALLFSATPAFAVNGTWPKDENSTWQCMAATSQYAFGAAPYSLETSKSILTNCNEYAFSDYARIKKKSLARAEKFRDAYTKSKMGMQAEYEQEFRGQ
jgi:hypothetical protein